MTDLKNHTSATQTNLILHRGDVMRQMKGFGEVDISGAADNVDIWQGPTPVQPEPETGGYSLFVESASAADAAAGTGVRTARVHYLDTAGVEQSVDVTMTGTTPVDTLVDDCMFVNNFHALTVGSGLVAAGNIDCTQGSGGTVVSRILAAGNWALSTMRQVPAGKNLCISGWHAVGTAGTVKEAIIRLRATNHGFDVFPGVYLFKDTARVKDNATGLLTFDPIEIIPALATVKVSAWTTGAINVAASWRGWLENS